MISLQVTPRPFESKHLTRSQTRRFYMLPVACALRLLRPSFAQTISSSTGISTCCPSTTPLGLVLGPDLPWADEPAPGNLSHSADKILTYLSLLIPAFSLLSAPLILSIKLRRTYNALLPRMPLHASTVSVLCLAPVHFRRSATRLVSYYALFE